jgi:alanyl-tRNA synthetase
MSSNFLFSIILTGSFPQAASKKGASASDWTAAVSGVVGGKAGGKGATSIGNGTHADKVNEAVSIATQYLEKLSI